MLPEQTTGTQPHLLIFPPSFVCLCQRARCSERPWMNQCMDLKKTLELKGQVHTVACFDVGGGERGYRCCYLKSILNTVKIWQEERF